jgi:hypothetical protein
MGAATSHNLHLIEGKFANAGCLDLMTPSTNTQFGVFARMWYPTDETV